MIKKIFGITLLLLFSGALIYGGINRTLAKSSGEASSDHETTTVQNEANDAAPRLGQTQTETATDEHIWLTVSGIVTEFAKAHLLVQTESGAQIEVADRAWSFAQQLGFTAQAGDRIELTGFDENGAFEMSAIANLRSGQHIQVRGEDGRPLWSGRGRRTP